MSLMLPAHVAAEAARKRAEAHAANLKKTRVNRLDSDDFLTLRDVQAQLDDLAAYVAGRRETEPGYRLPRPVGWRLQVLMLTIPETSAGGVIVVDDAREQRSLASPQGVVLAMGSAAYIDPARFTVVGAVEPWCAVGDRIQLVKYDAQFYQLANGQRLGVITDTQPVAVIDQGWEVPK